MKVLYDIFNMQKITRNTMRKLTEEIPSTACGLTLYQKLIQVELIISPCKDKESSFYPIGMAIKMKGHEKKI